MSQTVNGDCGLPGTTTNLSRVVPMVGSLMPRSISNYILLYRVVVAPCKISIP